MNEKVQIGKERKLKNLILLALMILMIEGCGETLTQPIVTNEKSPIPPVVNLDKAGVKFAQALILEDHLVALQGGRASATKETAMNNFNISEIVDSRKLSKDYDANEVAADNKYKTNKYILVTGKVSGISKDYSGAPYVSLPGQQMFYGIQARFDKDHLETLSKLTKGQTLFVVCKVSNKIMNNVMLNDCATLEDYAESVRMFIDAYVLDVLTGKTQVSSTNEIKDVILFGYILHKYLPSDSPCYKDFDDKCSNDVQAVFKNPALKEEMKMAATTLFQAKETNP